MNWNDLENLMEGLTTCAQIVKNGKITHIDPPVNGKAKVYVQVEGKYYEINDIIVINTENNFSSLKPRDAFFTVKEE